MWRYVEGVKPPEKRKCISSEERLANRRKYEKEERMRTFKSDWAKEFEWLQHDPDSNTMTCSACKEFDTECTSSFVKGCGNMKHDALVKHESSDIHLKCMKANKAKSAKVGSTPAEKILSSLNKQQYDRMCNLFIICHGLAKHARPFTDIEWQCKMAERHGVDIGHGYRNQMSAKVFTHYIAQVVRRSLCSDLQQAPFWTVIIDGSNDSASLEAELLYVRYVKKGKICSSFASYVNVDRANAPGILGALDTGLERLGLAQEEIEEKVLGLGSDGASVMLGKKRGVAALLKERQPLLQAVHCAAHRLELAFKDTFRKNALHVRCETLLLGLHLFYKRSGLNRANLKISFSILNDPCVVPTLVGGTRWIPHTVRALENVLKGYQPITAHLIQVFTYLSLHYDCSVNQWLLKINK